MAVSDNFLREMALIAGCESQKHTNPTTTVFSRSVPRPSPSRTFRSSPAPSFTPAHAPCTPTPATMSSSSKASSPATVSSALALALVCLAGFASARMPYVFSSGSESITGQVAQTFSCEGLPYGYYADVDNACRIFHICLPIPDDLGQVSPQGRAAPACGSGGAAPGGAAPGGAAPGGAAPGGDTSGSLSLSC
nr:uncharacterized protein LOC113827070 [Penaeus vannamei]